MIKFAVSLSILAFGLMIGGCRLTDPNIGDGSKPYIYHISEIETPGNSHAVDLSTNRAYVADGAGGLRIVDISSPHFLLEVDKYEDESMYYDVKYKGNYTYLACGSEGLKIVDIESPFGLEVIGEFETINAFGLDLAGDYLYLADDTEGVRILDVSVVYSIRELSQIHLSGQSVYSVKVDWPYLYVGSRYGFSVVNIDNPYTPYEEYFEQLDYVYDIEISGQYVYVAYYGGLDIYDISNTKEPQLKSRLIQPAPARSVTVRGDFAYLTLGTSGLSIIRITDPSDPYEVAWYRPPDCEMNDAVLSGKYVYIANGGRGMLVVEFWYGQ